MTVTVNETAFPKKHAGAPASPEAPDLTVKQFEFLRSFVEHSREHGRPASIRQMMALMGITSPNGTMCHVRALISKGYLVNQEVSSARGLSLTPRALALFTSVDRTTHTGLVILSRGTHQEELTPVEAEALAEELLHVARLVREAG